LRLHEYRAKELFREYGIQVPKGGVAKTPQEAAEVAAVVGGPVAVKAQVLVAGRGKAGGIIRADNPAEAGQVAERLLASPIKGLRPSCLLVEEWLPPEKELYLAFTVNRATRSPVVLASAEGGVDVEAMAEKIVRHPIDPLIGLKPYEARWLAAQVGLKGAAARAFADVALKLYRVFVEFDCELVESNPLGLVGDRVVAMDARVIVDDNALYRHPEFKDGEDLSPLEREAREKGFAFVELDGSLGVIGNGAGLVMATLDTVAHFGARPACFLDVGGGARSDVVREAVSLTLRYPRVKAVLINILGGITRCDEVARGLVEALEATDRPIPLVVRLVGTREEEGRQILEAAGLDFLTSMEEAAKRAAELVEEG
jgi:succinyl-CoA synthetase beta subunit